MGTSEQVADAIDLVLRARFTAGEEPPDTEPAEVQAAHAMARRDICSRMRAFQRGGISSRYVAMALRAGYLRVELDPPEST